MFQVQVGPPLVFVAHSSVPLLALSFAPLYGFFALAWRTPEPVPAIVPVRSASGCEPSISQIGRHWAWPGGGQISCCAWACGAYERVARNATTAPAAKTRARVSAPGRCVV